MPPAASLAVTDSSRAAAGWYQDTSTGVPVQRYWDGAAWTRWVLRDGIPVDLGTLARDASAGPGSGTSALDPLGGATGAIGAAAGTLGALLPGGPGWQVAVGPRLPVLPPLTAEGLSGSVLSLLGGRLLGALRNPVVSLAVTSFLSLAPAFMAAVGGADAFLWIRAALAVIAVVGTVVGPRLVGRARLVAAIAPAVFACSQLIAVGALVFDVVNGKAGPGYVLPALVGALATILVAGLIAWRARTGAGRGAGSPLAPRGPGASGGWPDRIPDGAAW